MQKTAADTAGYEGSGCLNAAVRLRRVWVFVRVIDNFGDIGVAWRLARLLVSAYGADVQLWVDDAAALAKLTTAEERAACCGVAVHEWRDDVQTAAQMAALPAPDCVIEMFGCELPETVKKRMAADKPLWLNWEYLSAEDWARDTHGLPSLQGNGVAKYFWLMGFDRQSGGLLRERDYATERQAFAGSPQVRQAFCRRYGLPETHRGRLWLVFAYASPVWVQWLDMWEQAGEEITVWLAGGQVADSLRAAGWLPENALRRDGETRRCGCVTLVRIPFVPQSAFDRLLWLADAAVVRGEDSFVRAQWAGLPFFWHIYRQENAAHVPKLHAFWRQAAQHWLPEMRSAFGVLSDELNGAAAGQGDAAARLDAWKTLQSYWPDWRSAAQQWSQTLAAQPDALERLAIFCADRLK